MSDRSLQGGEYVLVSNYSVFTWMQTLPSGGTHEDASDT